MVLSGGEGEKEGERNMRCQAQEGREGKEEGRKGGREGTSYLARMSCVFL